MNKLVFGVDINIPGIEVAIVDVEEKEIISGFVSETIDTNESADNLIDSWARTIQKCADANSVPITSIGIAIPGPFDYENGISLMKDQGKFDAIYQLNIKELLAERLHISPENILTNNNTPCFLQGEVLAGSGKGFDNILAFTLNYGLGSAFYSNGKAVDAGLWNKPFKAGICEDYLGIDWLAKKYAEFTGDYIQDLQELTSRAKTDDGIGQLVFNEYGENFVKFLLQYIPSFNPSLILIGGHNRAWDFFIPHVKERLHEKNINTPIKPAILGKAALLIGAANSWAAVG